MCATWGFMCPHLSRAEESMDFSVDTEECLQQSFTCLHWPELGGLGAHPWPNDPIPMAEC